MLCYIGINETHWNQHNTMPGKFACISPTYGSSDRTRRENRVKVPAYTQVIQDSGAFSDGNTSRLSPSKALDRQIEHGHKFDYDHQITHRASYDMLIDEVWTDGNRYKRRWSENEAWDAVAITVDAAKHLSRNYNGPRILSAQGVTDRQYLECTTRILEYLNPTVDIFGLGGWCISGKMPSVMREPFDETIALVIPALALTNIKRVHIWGVMDVQFLGPLLYLCDQYEMTLSSDSSGPSVRPCNGEWGYRGWRNNSYQRPCVSIRGIHRALHVIRTRQWLTKNLRQTHFYKPPMVQPKQMFLF